MSSNGLTLNEVEVGTELPELPIDITTSLVVGGAIASRDFTPVHHDKIEAQAAGMPDVFMNILTTNGLVNRYNHRLGGFRRRDPQCLYSAWGSQYSR